MIVVEGPDGAGKTTLINVLAETFDLPIEERVVSKETKALTDLRVWTDRNLEAGFVFKLFDRHRLISDPVYRWAIPTKQPDKDLYEVNWLEKSLERFQDIDPIIIFCMPPLETVMANLLDDPDNREVVSHILRIYYSYNLQYAYLKSYGSFSSVYWFDYTKPSATELCIEWLAEELKAAGND